MTTIGELKQKLFTLFPHEDATPGDRIGLLVGSTAEEVKGIAVALDAKVTNIEAAAAAGCNVLVTHHPVFWYPPTEFVKEGSSEGAAVYAAAKLGVSLITLHTNLDCAPVARGMLLEPAGFTYLAPLALPQEADSELVVAGKAAAELEQTGEQAGEQAAKPVAGLGQLGKPKEGDAIPFEDIVASYKKEFGAVAKAWGNPSLPVKRLATCSGSGSSLIKRVIHTGADCYVTGEVAYHEALELAHAGVALIELGHDRSELPYRFYLKDALVQAGIEEEHIKILGATAEWWQ